MSWIHAVIDVPAVEHAAAGRFWAQALGWQVGAPWPDHPELQSFEPPSGDPYMHLQQIDGAPGVHLDIESDTPETTVENAVRLGAALVGEQARWRTLRSPGGLPFCVLRATEHEPPQPVAYPDGHRARMVQICVDSPASRHDAEVAFWRALLAGRWADSDGL